MKKLLTVQDVSCYGKCSITVALPIISACGVEAVILPTAVFSTHTAFKGFVYKDLSDTLTQFCEHWKSVGVKFDGIYTGYLGSQEEIETVLNIAKEFGAKLFIDPVMGDNGKLYPAFNNDYVKENKKLCAVAEYLMPNITEASFLTGIPYTENQTESYINELIAGLFALGAKNVILKGINLEKGKLGVAIAEKVSGKVSYFYDDYIDKSFHGTGDIFASVFTASVIKGDTAEEAAKKAVLFVTSSMRKTLADVNPNWYGVNFEESLGMLTK